ncbi:MAG: NAD-dependent epimerase/dehydratase family protein [Planctomycetota bacterium]|nr:NAD-dependent epimerase/dehydratase family protein [Planctomycetota bacterium]
MKSVLVTGGGGFIGRHIVMKLLAKGYPVTVLGRRHYPDLASQGVRCLLGDLQDGMAVKQAADGCQAIIHTAGLAGLGLRPQPFYLANVLGTRHVLQAARELGISRLVYTSTPSVVYDAAGIEGGDESLPYSRAFLSPYAASKAEAEQMVIASNSPTLLTSAIRPHLVFGPGDNHLIPGIFERAKTGRLRQIGNGSNLVSVSYVEDVAESHLLALESLGGNRKAAGQVYFINQPEPVNCWDFINSLLIKEGLPRVSRHLAYSLALPAGWLVENTYRLLGRRTDPPLTRFLVSQLATSHWFKTSKAERDLGWRPRVGLAAGLERLFAARRKAAGAG